jgi:histidyl-tRNA synthetase
MSFNIELIETPLFEEKDLFSRTLGNSSDVVSKEMYDFQDKKGRDLVLRPESTASVVRYMIEEKLLNAQNLPKAFLLTGPMFRYDRPQAGRYRQFNQFSVEFFNVKKDINQDLISIVLSNKILNKLNIKNCFVEINNIGKVEQRKTYVEELSKYFKSNEAKLSDLSKERLIKNPLRILDSKEVKDIEVIKGCPKISDFYDKETKEELANLIKLLDQQKIKYVLNKKLVRGLDYYEGIVFEFKQSDNKELSQSTIIGGGRYDQLIKILDNKEVSACGFAGGIERLILSIDNDTTTNLLLKYAKTLYIGALSEDSILYILNEFDNVNDSLITRNLQVLNYKKHLEAAANSKYAILIGDQEIKNKKYEIIEVSTGKKINKELKDILEI